MLSFLFLSAFLAFFSVAQALVLPPLPRAITESTISLHNTSTATPLPVSKASAASPTTQEISPDAGAALPTTFATSLATTAANFPLDAASADTLADIDDQHGVIQRADDRDQHWRDHDHGLSSSDATHTHQKRCWPAFLKDTLFCADNGLHSRSLTSDVPLTAAKPKRRDLPKLSRDALLTDLSTAFQGPGVKKRDGSDGDVDNENEEEEKQATRILPRSSKETETKEEKEKEERSAGMTYRSLPSSAPSQPTPHSSHYVPASPRSPVAIRATKNRRDWRCRWFGTHCSQWEQGPQEPDSI